MVKRGNGNSKGCKRKRDSNAAVAVERAGLDAPSDEDDTGTR